MMGAGDPEGRLEVGWFDPGVGEGPQPTSASVIATAPTGTVLDNRPNITRSRISKFEHYTGLSFN
jgi:hypothetical protein